MIRATLILLAGCGMLSSGCLPPRLLASRDIPHIVAEEGEVIGWCRRSDGKVEKCRVEVLPGDIIAPQELIRPQVLPPTAKASLNGSH